MSAAPHNSEGKVRHEREISSGHVKTFSMSNNTLHKSQNSHTLQIQNLTRDVSKATWDCWQTTEDLWKILNAIPDEKIEKYEWDFILKSLCRNEQILSQDDSDFLFLYLDKDNSGDISKPELRALLNLVVRVNKWDENNRPSNAEMIKATYEYAFNDKKINNAIDYKLQMAVITVKNSLTKLLREMRSAKRYYGEITKAIVDSGKEVFPNPRNIFESHLKEHEEIFNKYADGPLQQQYENAKELLVSAEKEYKFVNSQIKEFLDQGRELERLRARDEKCCKILGCLCPCAF